jgi:hypothetical protein
MSLIMRTVRFATPLILLSVACAAGPGSNADGAFSDLDQRTAEHLREPAPITGQAGAELSARLEQHKAVHFYEQAPLPFHLGQGISAAKDPKDLSGFAPAQPLSGTCAAGDVKRVYDGMGTSGIGFEGALTSAPSELDAFAVRSLLRGTATTPPIALDRVAAYQAAVIEQPTRIAGQIEAYFQNYSFQLSGKERLTGTPAECGDFHVETVTAARFISFAFALDFQRPEDANALGDRWKLLGANTLFQPTPELSTFLVDRSVEVSVHVLVPSGLAEYVKSKVEKDVCDALHLDGCNTLKAHLLDVYGELNLLPGSAETLEAVLAPNSSWGVFDASLARNDYLLP